MAFIFSNTVLALFSAVAFYATGRVLATVFGFRAQNVSEKFAVYIPFGMAAYALAFTVFGFAHLYHPTTAYVALIAGCAFIGYKPRGLIEELYSAFLSVVKGLTAYKEPEKAFSVAIFTLLTVFFTLAALSPEIWKWDVLTYHLTLPARYITNGGIYFIPDIRASSFPQYQEQTNLFGMLLYSDRLSRFFVLTTWVSLAAMTYAGAKRFFGGRSANFAALTFIVCPFTLGFLPVSVNDLWWASFFCLSVFFAYRWAVNGGFGNILAASFLAGIAMGSKILHVFLLVYYFAFLIYALNKRRTETLKIIGSFAAFLSVSIIIASPWFVRNYIHTGDLLGFVNNDYENVAHWRGEDYPGGLLGKLLWFISLPTFNGPEVNAFTWPLLYLYVLFGRFSWRQCYGLGLLLYPGMLLSFFSGKDTRKRTIAFTLVILLYLLIWVFLFKATNPRYLLPIVPIMAILSGYGYSKFITSNRSLLKGVGIFVFVVSLALTAVGTKGVIEDRIEWVLVGVNPGYHKQYLLDVMFGGEDLPGAIDELPTESKIFSTDSFVYYLPDNVFVADSRNTFFFDYNEASNPVGLYTLIRAEGYTHVLSDPEKSDFYFPGNRFGGDPRRYQYHFTRDFLAEYAAPTGGADGDGKFGNRRLYRLKEENELTSIPRKETSVSELTKEAREAFVTKTD
ncbi:MAG: hypothetical protein JSW52_08005 [Candidatus Coatesbacteria bacterium]|nr:MAG: hypothetical protein JSW52_08005 [Candidatus Coatesbacteria bacterium]